MKKTTKILIIVATVLVVVGLSIFLIVLAQNDFDITKLDDHRTIVREEILTEDFNNIAIDVEIDDIIFLKTEEASAKVICKESEKLKFQINVVNDTLEIKAEDNNKWYRRFTFGFRFKTEQISIYLPKNNYHVLTVNNDVGNLKVPAGFTFTKIDVEVSTGNIEILSKVNNLNIETSTGDVKLSNLSADNINVETSTGKHTLENINVTNQIKLDTSTGTVTLKSVNLATLRVAISTGRVNLTDVVATNSFNINSSTGRVSLEKCDAAEIYIKTSTGSVVGTLLTSKIFHTKSDTGDINVPKTITGGICDIETGTRDIDITILNP